VARPDATDPTRLRREFAALPLGKRREVARSVSRGRAVEDRKLAVHAVVLARRQQRLWRWVWVAGPLIGVTQVGLGWQAAVAAIVVSTLTMGLLARYWFVRAARAETVNLELVPKRLRAGLQPPAPAVTRPVAARRPAVRTRRRGRG
jgi:hypothetical protein